MYGRHHLNGFNSPRNQFKSHMWSSINIHLEIGGCIMKDKIAGTQTVMTKGYWKDMIMARMKRKDIIRRYSKGSVEKLKSYGRKKVGMSILRR